MIRHALAAVVILCCTGCAWWSDALKRSKAEMIGGKGDALRADLYERIDNAETNKLLRETLKAIEDRKFAATATEQEAASLARLKLKIEEMISLGHKIGTIQKTHIEQPTLRADNPAEMILPAASSAIPDPDDPTKPPTKIDLKPSSVKGQDEARIQETVITSAGRVRLATWIAIGSGVLCLGGIGAIFVLKAQGMGIGLLAFGGLGFAYANVMLRYPEMTKWVFIAGGGMVGALFVYGIVTEHMGRKDKAAKTDAERRAATEASIGDAMIAATDAFERVDPVGAEKFKAELVRLFGARGVTKDVAVKRGKASPDAQK